MTRIILIGYMGAGKTTVGRALARKLNMKFYDLDWYIEDRFHKKIPDIFAEQGEEEFRKIEQKMLHETAEFENVIISCGGGTPCFYDNINYMNQQGETIFLNAKPSVLKEHLMMGKSQRPLIQGKTPEQLEEYIQQTLTTRLPYYTQAKHTINIDVIHTKDEIQHYADQIIKMINNQE